MCVVLSRRNLSTFTFSPFVHPRYDRRLYNGSHTRHVVNSITTPASPCLRECARGTRVEADEWFYFIMYRFFIVYQYFSHVLDETLAVVEQRGSALATRGRTVIRGSRI